MPGIDRVSISQAVEDAGEVHELGVPAVLLFGLPADKDDQGSGAYDVLWRRTLVAERVGQYDERLAYSMDLELWRRIAERLEEIANVPESLLYLRAHEHSMTATYGERTREGLRIQAAYTARLLGSPTTRAAATECDCAGSIVCFISRPIDRSRPSCSPTRRR